MRFWTLLSVLIIANAAWASNPDVTPAFLAWGGPGEQIFRNKVTLMKNNPHHDRAIMVLVDDLKPRGTRLGVARVAVSYSGGRNASNSLLSTIRKKTYEYQMVKVYQTLLSPKMARIVLPKAEGVMVRFSFYRTAHAPVDRSKDKGLIEELTRTIPAEQIAVLPVLNPMRDARVRKPRRGESRDSEESSQTTADEASSAGVEQVQGGTASSEVGSSEAAKVAGMEIPSRGSDDVGSVADSLQTREERAMARARVLAARMKEAQKSGVEQGETAPCTEEEVELAPIPKSSQGPIKPLGGVTELEDTPEMLQAQQRAQERLRQMRDQQL